MSTIHRKYAHAGVQLGDCHTVPAGRKRKLIQPLERVDQDRSDILDAPAIEGKEDQVTRVATDKKPRSRLVPFILAIPGCPAGQLRTKNDHGTHRLEPTRSASRCPIHRSSDGRWRPKHGRPATHVFWADATVFPDARRDDGDDGACVARARAGTCGK